MHSFKIYFVAVMLFLGTLIQAQPTITSFTPKSAKPGDTVTLTGTNFNTIAANNIVFFGATRATVTAATATSITATVPTGATYAPITLLNTSTNLACASNANFNPIYSPAKTGITINDFSPKVDFTTGDNPQSLAIGDIDGDGKSDLVVANYQSNTVSVFRNISTNGSITSGSFADKVDFTTGKNPRSVAIGDVDGDGKLDLVVTNNESNTVSVFRNTSTNGSITSSSFTAKVDFITGLYPSSVMIGDIDGDGKADLVVANGGSNTFSVFRNRFTIGSLNIGSFAAKVDFTTGTSPNSVKIGDIDGDGKLDIALANYRSNTVSIYRNISTNGSITSSSFASKVDFSTDFGPQSVAIGDLDGDDKLDLAVVNYTSNSVSIFKNTATSGTINAGSFAAKENFTAGTGPSSISIGDLDGDGKADLAVANYESRSISIFRNTVTSGTISAGSFAAKVDFTLSTSPFSVAIGDLDGDGKPDLAVPVFNIRVSLFRNEDIVFPLQPSITSFTPLNAKPGDTVTITGTKFNTTADSNIVFFGATKATVTAAAATSITATVPIGATYAPITILNTANNLAGASRAAFHPVFSPAKTGITSTDFSPKVDFATGDYPKSVAIGDIDGDGKPDLVLVNNISNTVSIYRNTATNGTINASSFAAKVDFITGTYPNSVAIGDINGDGKLDLAVVNYFSNTVSIYRNTATIGSITSSSFAAKVDFSTGIGPSSVAIGDIDGDGKLDLAVASGGVSVYRNTTTNGTIDVNSFAQPVGFPIVDFSFAGSNAESVAIRDFDGDGKADLAAATYQTISLLKNTSTIGFINKSSFAAVKIIEAGSISYQSIATGDLNGDGEPDLAFVSSFLSAFSVLFNITTNYIFAVRQSFSPISNAILTSLAIGDLNGDGKVDLVVGNNNPNSVSVYRNVGSSDPSRFSIFANPVNFPTSNNPRSVAIGDLDGDGKPDLVVANYESNTVSVFRNADIVLPINLGNFSVNKKENTASIQWSSKEETNALEYQIERSANASAFIAIGTVATKGLGSNYHFVDNNPIIGINYYRLKMIDKDGTYSYSELRTVNFKQETTSLSIYPNPILNGKLNIDFGEKVTSKMHYQILNSSGIQIQQGVIVNRQETIDVPRLRKGVYVLQFEKGYKTFIVN